MRKTEISPADWQPYAKCRGQDPTLWYTDSLKRGQGPHAIARERCEGCPVRRLCAADALKYGDTGVIKAGIPLGDTANYNRTLGLYRKLEMIADGYEPPAPKVKEKQLPLYLPDAPAPKDPTPYVIDGSEWVTRAGAEQILGISDSTIQKKRKEGVLKLSVKYVTRTPKQSRANTFFSVAELNAVKGQTS